MGLIPASRAENLGRNLLLAAWGMALKTNPKLRGNLSAIVGKRISVRSECGLSWTLLDLAGYGILAIWFALHLFQRRHTVFSFALLVVTLGISDGSFIYSLLLRGYSPLVEGLSGPFLFPLGVPLTTKVLFSTEGKVQ